MPLIEHTQCKNQGLIFRGKSSLFFNSRTKSLGIVSNLRLIKRKSCSCRNCLRLLECLQEKVDEGDIRIPDIEEKALYGLKVTNEKIDKELWIAEDYEIEFYKLAVNS
jgi:hypothetical protein